MLAVVGAVERDGAIGGDALHEELAVFSQRGLADRHCAERGLIEAQHAQLTHGAGAQRLADLAVGPRAAVGMHGQVRVGEEHPLQLRRVASRGTRRLEAKQGRRAQAGDGQARDGREREAGRGDGIPGGAGIRLCAGDDRVGHARQEGTLHAHHRAHAAMLDEAKDALVAAALTAPRPVGVDAAGHAALRERRCQRGEEASVEAFLLHRRRGRRRLGDVDRGTARVEIDSAADRTHEAGRHPHAHAHPRAARQRRAADVGQREGTGRRRDASSAPEPLHRGLVDGVARGARLTAASAACA